MFQRLPLMMATNRPVANKITLRTWIEIPLLGKGPSCSGTYGIMNRAHISDDSGHPWKILGFSWCSTSFPKGKDKQLCEWSCFLCMAFTTISAKTRARHKSNPPSSFSLKTQSRSLITESTLRPAARCLALPFNCIYLNALSHPMWL